MVVTRSLLRQSMRHDHGAVAAVRASVMILTWRCSCRQSMRHDPDMAL